MPRIALVVLCVVGGCSFEANYAGGVYTCSDERCPDGMECVVNLDNDKVCRERRKDAGADAPGDGVVLIDAPPPLKLNCELPGSLTNGELFADSTEKRSNKLMTSCLNKTMSGFDAVHVITPGAGKYMTVTVEAAFAVTAYVLSACPQTACNGNNYATPGNPLTIYTLAGPHYVIVDSAAAAASGDYTVTASY